MKKNQPEKQLYRRRNHVVCLVGKQDEEKDASQIVDNN